MYEFLLKTHSGLRYLVLLMLLVVIVNSLIGLTSKKTFGKTDNLLSLVLLITTHIQFLAGLVLYFVSPRVVFNDQTMQGDFRYWTIEHSTIMIIAVALITIARSTSKKLSDPVAKHRRLFLLNTVALAIILVAIVMSGRKLFG